MRAAPRELGLSRAPPDSYGVRWCVLSLARGPTTRPLSWLPVTLLRAWRGIPAPWAILSEMRENAAPSRLDAVHRLVGRPLVRSRRRRGAACTRGQCAGSPSEHRMRAEE